MEEVPPGLHLLPVELDAELNVSDGSLSVELKLIQPLRVVFLYPLIKLLQY